jgi:hypothetical protein
MRFFLPNFAAIREHTFSIAFLQLRTNGKSKSRRLKPAPRSALPFSEHYG